MSENLVISNMPGNINISIRRHSIHTDNVRLSFLHHSSKEFGFKIFVLCYAFLDCSRLNLNILLPFSPHRDLSYRIQVVSSIIKVFLWNIHNCFLHMLQLFSKYFSISVLHIQMLTFDNHTSNSLLFVWWPSKWRRHIIKTV